MEIFFDGKNPLVERTRVTAAAALYPIHRFTSSVATELEAGSREFSIYKGPRPR